MESSAPYRPPLLRRPRTASPVNGTPGRCPFLGTPADPGTSLAFASDANHCFRSRFPVPVSSIHQESYCLSAQYGTCPIYRQYAETDEKDGAALIPLTAVAAGMAGAATWAPEPAAPVAAPVAAATVASAAAPVAPSPFLATAEPLYPDFPMDPGPDPATVRPERRAGAGPVNGRVIVAGLVLLALLVLAGWAWLNMLRNRADDSLTAVGTVVALPSPVATLESDQPESGIAVGLAAEQTATALAAPAQEQADQAATGDAALAGATSESSLLDSVAATATALFAGPVTEAECGPPDWWVRYVVQEGETVEGLAAARGILPEELIVGNCLTTPALVAGQQLFLPPVGVIVLLPGDGATATPTATAPAGATAAPGRPTGVPVIFPTATFPIVIIIPTFPVNVEETVEPTRETPPERATPVPPSSTTRPTATPPGGGPAPTLTPPGGPTPTRTPPGGGPAPTLTPPGGQPTRTPPGNAPTRTPPASSPTRTPAPINP